MGSVCSRPLEQNGISPSARPSRQNNNGNKRNRRYTSGSKVPQCEELVRYNIINRLRTSLKRSGTTDAEIEIILNQTITELTEQLNSIMTIDDIKSIINALYGDGSDASDEKEPIRFVREITGLGVNNLFRMNASGNNQDCLIHSFLSSTCPRFRNITQRSRDEFANIFRRYVLLRLPVFQCFRSEAMTRSIMADIGFLGDSVVDLLAAQFGVNILAINGRMNSFVSITPESLRVILPKTCIDSLPNSELFDNTIIIYTSDAHFEPVRFGDKYIINHDEYYSLIRENQAARPAAASPLSLRVPTKPFTAKDANESNLAAIEAVYGKGGARKRKQTRKKQSRKRRTIKCRR